MTAGSAMVRATAIEYLLTFLVFMLGAYCLRAWVLEARIISSASMRPALAVGDWLLVEKLTPRWRIPVRGTVVVFFPAMPAMEARGALVKRVVALPGERIDFRGRRVWINGRPLPEPYLPAGVETIFLRGRTAGATERRVPAEHVFVLGDNRRDSTDSRHFGPVSLRKVIGSAILGFWPLERWRWLRPQAAGGT